MLVYFAKLINLLITFPISRIEAEKAKFLFRPLPFRSKHKVRTLFSIRGCSHIHVVINKAGEWKGECKINGYKDSETPVFRLLLAPTGDKH